MTYNTDKIANGFIEYYKELINFSEVTSLLEIGVLNGGSLRLWADLLPETSKIVGIDINDPQGKFPSNVTFLKINQNDSKALTNLTITHNFDLVIEDGCHKLPESKTCFEAIWPHLKSNSIYIIEDFSSEIAWLQPLYNYVLELYNNQSEFGIKKAIIIDKIPKFLLLIKE